MNKKTKSFLSGGIIGVLTRNPENKDKRASGFAIASLILGILSVILGWFPIFGWVIIILAIVFGIRALIKINQGICSGRSMAVAGVILGIAGVILSILFMKYALTSSARCSDINCFTTKANLCTAVTYTEINDFGTISYSIKPEDDSGYCVLTKQIVELSKNEDPFLKKVLEGKKMECAYSPNEFNSLWVTSMVDRIEDCHGELKGAIIHLLLLV